VAGFDMKLPSSFRIDNGTIIACHCTIYEAINWDWCLRQVTLLGDDRCLMQRERHVRVW